MHTNCSFSRRADERRPRLLAACHQSATHEHQSDVIGLTDRAPFIALTVNPPPSLHQLAARSNAGKIPPGNLFFSLFSFSLGRCSFFQSFIYLFFFLQGTVHLSAPLPPQLTVPSPPFSSSCVTAANLRNQSAVTSDVNASHPRHRLRRSTSCRSFRFSRRAVSSGVYLSTRQQSFVLRSGFKGVRRLRRYQ